MNNKKNKLIALLNILIISIMSACADVNATAPSPDAAINTDVVYFIADFANSPLNDGSVMTLEDAEAICDLTHPAAEVAIGTPTNGFKNPDETAIRDYVNLVDGYYYIYKYLDVYPYTHNDGMYYLSQNASQAPSIYRVICQINVLIN